MLKTTAFVALAALLLSAVALPALAATPVAATPVQEEEAQPARPPLVSQWIAIAAAFAMSIASSICGLAQGRSVIAACEGIARNPGAAGDIRGSLIIGLVLIESLAIYTLLVALLLIFVGV